MQSISSTDGTRVDMLDSAEHGTTAIVYTATPKMAMQWIANISKTKKKIYKVTAEPYDILDIGTVLCVVFFIYCRTY